MQYFFTTFAPVLPINIRIMILGYVVTDSKISKQKPYIKYVQHIEDTTCDKPCLVVGYQKAKSSITNFSALNKKVSPTLFWTLGRTEKRTAHEKDLNDFYKYVLEFAVKDLKYYYVDIFKLTWKQKKNIVHKVTDNVPLCIYSNNGMLYVFSSEEKYVLGISIPVLTYCHINVDKHLNRLRGRQGCTVYEVDSPFVKPLLDDIGDNEYAIACFLDHKRQ